MLWIGIGDERIKAAADTRLVHDQLRWHAPDEPGKSRSVQATEGPVVPSPVKGRINHFG